MCGVWPGQKPQEREQPVRTVGCQQEVSATVWQLQTDMPHQIRDTGQWTYLEYLSLQEVLDPVGAGHRMLSSPTAAAANLTWTRQFSSALQ